MKAAKLLVILLLGIGISTTSFAQQKSNTETAVFKTNVVCNNCVNKVEKNVPFEKGVKDVSVNLETKEVTIAYDAKKTDKAKLKKALEKLHLDPQEVEENKAQ